MTTESFNQLVKALSLPGIEHVYGNATVEHMGAIDNYVAVSPINNMRDEKPVDYFMDATAGTVCNEPYEKTKHIVLMIKYSQATAYTQFEA